MKIYMLVTLIASGASYAKLVVLLGVIPIDQYGLYVSSLGLAIFLSYLFSLGFNESLHVKFPKLYYRKALSEIRSLLKKAVVVYSTRFVIFFLLFLLVDKFFLDSFTIASAFAVFAYSILLLLAQLAASLLRAIQNNIFQMAFVVAKGFFPSLATISFGLFVSDVDWKMLLLFESLVISIYLSVFFIFIWYCFLRESRPDSSLITHEEGFTDRTGFTIFGSFLLSNSIFSLDKFIVSKIFDAETAGLYAALLLLPQAFVLLSNAVVQRDGVSLVHDSNEGRAIEARTRLIRYYKFLTLGILSVYTSVWAIGCVMDVTYLSLITASADLYFLSAALAFLYTFSILDFLLYSSAREMWSFYGSLVAVIIFACGVALLQSLGFGLFFFVLSVAVSRLIQFLILVIGSFQLLRGSDGI